MLVALAISRSNQVLVGGPDDAGRKPPGDLQFAAVEELEKAQGVLAFLVGGFLEDVCNLNKTVLPGTACEVGVAVAGLGFAGIP